jgi:leucyl-tRNA synthetase
MDQIGFSFDWDREVRTSNPIITNIHNGFLSNCSTLGIIKNRIKQNITTLTAVFEKDGNAPVKTVCDDNSTVLPLLNGTLTQKILRRKFITIPLNLLSRGEVNWCPGLGTV